MEHNMKRNIKPFEGEKYSVWKFRIRALFTELNVIKVIDSEIPSTLTEEWNKAERIAKSTLVEYLSDSFLNFATPTATAKEILTSLDNIYERKSLATQLALRKKLLSLKLQGDTTLIKHFTQFDDLIRELLAAGAKLEETDKVSHLLLTLPTSYDGIITAIETLSEDNISLAFVKTRLLDHEVKLGNENKDTSAKVLNIEAVNENLKKGVSKDKFIKRKKFQFNKNNKFKINKNNFNVKCHQCGRKGHIKRDCFYYKKGLEFRNNERKRTVQSVQISDPSNSNSDANISNFAFMAGDFETVTSIQRNKISFILDSGASDHIINREDLTENFEVLGTPIRISVAKNSTFIKATRKGTLNLTTNTGVQVVIRNVLFCPEVPYNLLSVTKMREAGMTIIFNKKGVEVNTNGKVLMVGKILNNLYSVDFTVNRNKINSACITSSKKISYELWHQRLGHISINKFLELKNKRMADDVGLIDNIIPNDSLCEACIMGKQSCLPFNKSKDKHHINRPLFVVHSDVCGPITPPSINDKNYFVLFVDEFTHYCVTYLIAQKSEVFSTFKDFVAKSETHFNSKIVNFYCDNGGEYLSNEMKAYFVQKGISYHLTVPRTPQLNGVSERMVRTITEKARAIIVGANLEKNFWGDAVLTATYLINIIPTKALKQLKTPYELWHNKKPQIKYLKVFGSTVYVHDKTSKTKFDRKSWKGILVGYEPNGYKVWNVETGKYVVVRDVIVDENNFVVSRPVGKCNENGSKNSQRQIDVFDVESNSVKGAQKSDKNNKSDTIFSENTHSGSDNMNEKIDVDNYDRKRSNSSLRRSDRIKNCPPVSYNDEYNDDYLMCAQSIICNIPASFQEISIRNDRNQWEQAINNEINSLLVNNTWTLVSRPENKNIVDCKWVFNVKIDEFGNPIRYKARLVARGFSQKYLTDYDETFAPVARIASFRLIVAFANQFNLLIHHMDVKTAFLNGELKEEIYMRVPEGIKCKDNQVCKLNKALYGLKQAAKCWFEVFEKTLKDVGFQNSPVDRCIYINKRGDISKNIYVVLYVDDLVIVTAKIDTMNSFKDYLMHKFRMVDLKEIKLFLGIKITRNENKIMLDQSSYIKTILKKFNMEDCNSLNTPLETKIDYKALNSDDKFDAPCRNLVGCLMYLMVCTRPDLSFAINVLSRFVNKNNKELWKCLKRVLRYLKGSIAIRLTYERNDYRNILTGYVDSDWGGNDTSDRKSTSGYLFKLFERCTICWNTKRQVSVAASSTEAEYMALFEAVREALWLKSLAKSISIEISEPIIIYEDNNGCISIANNPTDHKRTKHIDIKYHFSREQIEKNIIKLNYIPTGEQIADVLTKSLPASRFLEFRSEMNLQ